MASAWEKQINMEEGAEVLGGGIRSLHRWPGKVS